MSSANRISPVEKGSPHLSETCLIDQLVFPVEQLTTTVVPNAHKKHWPGITCRGRCSTGMNNHRRTKPRPSGSSLILLLCFVETERFVRLLVIIALVYFRWSGVWKRTYTDFRRLQVFNDLSIFGMILIFYRTEEQETNKIKRSDRHAPILSLTCWIIVSFDFSSRSLTKVRGNSTVWLIVSLLYIPEDILMINKKTSEPQMQSAALFPTCLS